VRRVLAAVEDGWDVAIGDRRHPDSRALVAPSPLRAWGSEAVNWLGYAVLLGSYRDTQCGLKGLRSDVARFVFARTRVDGFAFDIEVLHLVERHQMSLVEVPVEVAHSSRSTVRAARDAARLVVDLFRIRHWSAEGAYEADDDLPPVLPEPGAVVRSDVVPRG
jgi:dolichyl-phosphate beta-glucosyltransferase